MKKYLISAISVAAMLAGGLVLSYAIAAPAKKVAAALDGINDITVGQTSEYDLLARPFFQASPRNCMEAYCFYYVTIDNSVLRFLHLAPRTEIRTVVRVNNGVVDKVMVTGMIWRADGFSFNGLSFNQDLNAPECNAEPCLRKTYDPRKVLRSQQVLFGPESRVRKQMPLVVNTACLSRLHGCTLAELMPTVKLD